MIEKLMAKNLREIAKDISIDEDEKILKILEAIHQNAYNYDLVKVIKHDEIYKLLLTGKDSSIEITLK